MGRSRTGQGEVSDTSILIYEIFQARFRGDLALGAFASASLPGYRRAGVVEYLYGVAVGAAVAGIGYQQGG